MLCVPTADEYRYLPAESKRNEPVDGLVPVAIDSIKVNPQYRYLRQTI